MRMRYTFYHNGVTLSTWKLLAFVCEKYVNSFRRIFVFSISKFNYNSSDCFVLLQQATYKGWTDVMNDAIDSREVSHFIVNHVAAVIHK